MMTLDRFILESQQRHPGATGELTSLLLRFGVAGKRIARELSTAGLRAELGNAGTRNVHGEEQKKLDVLANEILLETFDYGGLVSMAASEELETPFVYAEGEGPGRYAVLFDPLDGSPNIDVNGSLGMIFSIRSRESDSPQELLRSGHEQVAAGYVLFGPSVLFVYTSGEGVNLFALDPAIGEFLLVRRGVRMPERGKSLAVNEGRHLRWPAAARAYVSWLKEEDKGSGRPYATRYCACMVSDFHRILLEGGIYLYPEDATKTPPKSKLRVLYECHPLALVAEQAGGLASTGSKRVLDLVPDDIHARCPIAIGSKWEVEAYERYYRQPSTVNR
jgi:fructose-1,6-bisphosphatase I